MKKAPKSVILFAIAMLLLSGFIAYLGFRTVEHEALLRHYQQQSLAQSRTEQVSRFIYEALNLKAARIDSMVDFMQFDPPTLRQLTARDGDIDAVFILKGNQLIYPNEADDLTQKEQVWIQTITPIINDPSMLFSHVQATEFAKPNRGWFIANEDSEPVFLYWIQREDSTLGFKVSYIKLISDIINSLDIDHGADIIVVKDNDRLLYQSSGSGSIDGLKLIDSRRLPYPLTRWQVDYYAKEANNALIYLWGGALILLLVAVFGLVMFRLYREYTQTARLARQQVNFVGQVSHELKTPLTNITLYAEILKEEQAEREPDGQIMHYLDVITGESQRLSRLIQNILSFTKASKVHLKPVELSELIHKIARTFIPAYESKGIEIHLEINDDVKIETDEDRLTQIISNFLSNAEKYAAQGRRVDLIVEANREKGTVSIHVRDYGDGIAAKEQKAIFQPFYRVKSDITEGVSGTGIGLTIAAQLAQSLNGAIAVENSSPGVRFTFTAPYLSAES
jgi:two-component system phosphate regulon sensor histidine kinase PhoR